MSPNMMLAVAPAPANSTVSFHISSRSSAAGRFHPGHVATYVPGICCAAALLQLFLNYFGETVRATFILDNVLRFTRTSTAARYCGRDSLPPSCCDRSGRGNRPATSVTIHSGTALLFAVVTQTPYAHHSKAAFFRLHIFNAGAVLNAADATHQARIPGTSSQLSPSMTSVSSTVVQSR